jgi:hypothetical protein
MTGANLTRGNEMTTKHEELRKLREVLADLAQKGCEDCFAQDCNWPACMPQAKEISEALAASKSEPQHCEVGPEYCPRCGVEDGGTSCGLPECGLIVGVGNDEPEPQAQAEEPEVSVEVKWAADVPRSIKEYRSCNGYIPKIGDQLIILQAHREAIAECEKAAKAMAAAQFELLNTIAKRDAALDACVEALHSIDQQIDLGKYPSAPPDVTLLDELRAAITKAREARKS